MSVTYACPCWIPEVLSAGALLRIKSPRTGDAIELSVAGATDVVPDVVARVRATPAAVAFTPSELHKLLAVNREEAHFLRRMAARRMARKDARGY